MVTVRKKDDFGMPRAGKKMMKKKKRFLCHSSLIRVLFFWVGEGSDVKVIKKPPRTHKYWHKVVEHSSFCFYVLFFVS